MAKARRSKLKSLAAAARLVPDGTNLALGGFSIHNRPCGFARALVARGAKNLTLYGSPIGSFDLELLIAAECASASAVPVISFEQHGLAPMYRHRAETKQLTILEGDEATLVGGYMATIENVPYHPITSVKGCDLLEHSPHIIRDPGAPTIAADGLIHVRPLAPDVCVIHAAEADIYGNVRHGGAVSCDLVLAKASTTVIVTVERLIDPEAMASRPARITVPGYLVDAVVELPFGAHPTSCHGEYIHDEQHLAAYSAAATSTAKGRDKRALDQYLRQYAKVKPDAYVAKCGGKRTLRRRLSPSPTRHAAAPPRANQKASIKDGKGYAPQELMAVLLSREIRDGETSLVGLASSLALGAALLAQRRHAPNSTVVTTAGFVNPKPKALYLSCSDGRYGHVCEGYLDFYEIFELSECHALDFFCYGGLQIDQFGNVNLTVLGSLDAPKLRGPGLANISFAVTAKRMYLQSVNHSTRTFVPRVDYISAPGHIDGPEGRRNAGITTEGPVLCVTPLCTFGFPPETRTMTVQTLHPGVPWADVEQHTGFPLTQPTRLKRTKPPTRDELAQLRAIDTTGILRR